MSDDDLLHTEQPDRAHEAMRVAVVAALDGLAEQVERINDAFLMLSVNADFAQATKNTVKAAGAGNAQVQAALSALNTRTDAAQTAAKTAIQNADLLQTQMADVLARLDALQAGGSA